MCSEEDRIRAALSFVPADDRNTWVEMAYAVKQGLGESGFDIWDAWSQSAGSYDPKAAKAVWKSVRPDGRVSVASLFWHAGQHGFDPLQYLAAPSDPQEEARRRAGRAQREAKAREEVEAKREAAARNATTVWTAAKPAGVDHPYLVRKAVEPVETLREIDAAALKGVIGYAPGSDGELLEGRVLVAPVKVDGKVSSIEFVDESGRKSALAGGAKSGGYWASGPLAGPDGRVGTIAVGEGIATMLSVHAATGAPAVAALSCHNLPKVAKALRACYPDADIVVIADRGNGQEHAGRAARDAGARLVVPAFTAGERIEGKHPTDVNDLARLHGPDAVAQMVAAASLANHEGRDADPGGLARIRDHGGRTLYEHSGPAHIGDAVEAAVQCGVSLAGAVLSGVNLDDRDLAGADMAHADLRQASLRNADLQRANLHGADVAGANFEGADLREADLIGSVNVQHARFIEAGDRNPGDAPTVSGDRAPDGSTGGEVSSRAVRGEIKAGVQIMSDVTEKPAHATRSRKAVPKAKEASAGPAIADKAAEAVLPREVAAAQQRGPGKPLFEMKDVPAEIRAAAQQRFGADIRMGVPRENALYKGEVFNTDRYLVQEVSTRSVVFHAKEGMEFVDNRLKWCNENQRLNGADVQVGYTGDRAKVYPYDRQRDQLEKVVASLKKSATELGMVDVGKTLDSLKEKSWERVKDARSTALEQAKARSPQPQPVRAVSEGPDR